MYCPISLTSTHFSYTDFQVVTRSHAKPYEPTQPDSLFIYNSSIIISSFTSTYIIIIITFSNVFLSRQSVCVCGLTFLYHAQNIISSLFMLYIITLSHTYTALYAWESNTKVVRILLAVR